MISSERIVLSRSFPSASLVPAYAAAIRDYQLRMAPVKAQYQKNKSCPQISPGWSTNFAPSHFALSQLSRAAFFISLL